MEPFKLNSNYIDIRAYDLFDGINKRFKTDRIGEVEILRDDWALFFKYPEMFVRDGKLIRLMV